MPEPSPSAGESPLLLVRGSRGTAILQASGTTLLWGTIPVAVKLVLPSFDPYAIAFLRYALGTLALLIWFRSQGKAWTWPRVSMGVMLVGGVASALNYIFYNLGLSYTTASAASFIIQGEAVVLLLLAWVFLDEGWSGFKAVGSIVCTVGMLIVGWNGHPLHEVFHSSKLLGNLLVFLAGTSWAVYAVCQKRALRQAESLQALIAFFLLASVLTGVAWAVAGTWPHDFTPVTVGGMLYMGILGTGLSYLLLTQAMRHMDASTAGMWTTPMPIVTAAMAFLLIGERPSFYTWVGGALVLAGLLILAREEE
ncbi:MAG: DMT family transporter [Armatimonadetes bacterium]|nr:DMT family transporter [Armatimonadota bacterium]